jgi:hypothetical protein
MQKISLLISFTALVLLATLLLGGCTDKDYPVSPVWKTWKNRDTVPGYILMHPSGSRGNVRAKGQMWDDFWALEVGSYLNSGNEDDHVFAVGTDLVFALYISDASDSIWNGQNLIHLVWSDTDFESPDTVSVYDLVANEKPSPTIDGDGSDEAWTFGGMPETQLEITGIAGDNGLREAYIMAAHDGVRIYFKLAWPDPSGTVDMEKDLWRFDGHTWTQEGEEDMVLFFFPTDQPPTDWESLGGATIDPQEGHPADGTLNVWGWGAGRTNPLGRADDLLATETELQLDDGVGVANSNYDQEKSFPPYVQHPAIEASLGEKVLLAWEAVRYEDTVRP